MKPRPIAELTPAQQAVVRALAALHKAATERKARDGDSHRPKAA